MPTPLSLDTITTDGTSFAATTIPTPDPGVLIVVDLVWSKGSSPDLPTSVTGYGITFSRVTDVLFNTIAAPTRRVARYQGTAATPTNATLTVNFGANTQTGCCIRSMAWPAGSTLGTAVTNRSDLLNIADTLGVTLAAFANTSSAWSLVAGTSVNNAKLSPKPGGVQDVDNGYGSPNTGIFTAYRTATTDNTPNIIVDTESKAVGLIAQEVLAPGGGGGGGGPPGTGFFDHCLWGAAIGGRGASDHASFGGTTATARQADLETLYGRPYEVIRIYGSAWNGTDLNTTRAQQIVASGAYLWASMKADSGTVNPNPSWPQVASGSQDSSIQGHADQMKAIYNTAGVNTAQQYLIFTFHHEPQGDNTGVAADFVAAFRHYNTVFDARMKSNTGGTAFAGTILYGAILFGKSFHDGSAATNGAGTGPWWVGDAYCDFAGADTYNWFPAPSHGTNIVNAYREFSANDAGGDMAKFAKAHLKPIFIGEVNTFEREPSGWNPAVAASSTNRWDSTTVSAQNGNDPRTDGNSHAGEGPPYDNWPADASVIGRDPDGSLLLKSAAAWTDHFRIFIGAQVFDDHSPVFQCICWYDQVAVFNRMTNSSQPRIDAMIAAAAAPQFNSGSSNPDPPPPPPPPTPGSRPKHRHNPSKLLPGV